MRTLLIALVALALVAIAGGAYWYLALRPGEPSAAQATQEAAAYASTVTNLRFAVPAGWMMLAAPEVPDMTQVEAVIEDAATGCRIALGVLPDGGIGSWRHQVSFDTRAFGPRGQYDGSWYVRSAQYPNAPEFSSHARQYLPGEMRIVRADDTLSFFLYQKDGASVPDACDAALTSVLESAETYYEPALLTVESEGIVSIPLEQVPGRVAWRRLAFTPAGSEERLEVMKLPEHFTSAPIFVRGTDLYALSYEYAPGDGQPKIESAIYVLNPFSGSSSVPDSLRFPGGYVSSFYVRENTLFYLLGDIALARCIDGYGPCTTDLYAHDLTTGTNTLLVSKVAGVRIEGFDADGGMYLSRNTGDAGCIAYRFVRYAEGTVTPLGSDDACVDANAASDGGADYAAARSFYASVMARLVPLAHSFALTVDGGALSPAVSDETKEPSFYFAQ